jgi:ribosomal protein S18 acetylase RimI-like enzyme
MLQAEVTQHITASAELARLIEENLNSKSEDFARLPGGQNHPGNPAWFTSGLPRTGYNGITCARFDEEDLDGQIQAALQPFRQAGLPLTWWVGPLSQPSDLGRKLQAHGFTHNRDMIGMAAELERLQPVSRLGREFSFEKVQDLAGLEAWMPLFMQTFGVPHSEADLVLDTFSRLSFSAGSNWRHYAIRAGGEVVATSSLHLGAGVAGLYNIATRPDLRQNGLGTAITLLTYAEARREGLELGTLQTTYPNALRIYHRIGFEVYCKFGIYQRAAWG